MSFVLLLLGVAMAAAGIAMIGFGIPINEFSLGNTLILSGMTALAGGFVVIALSFAVRQLIRIANALSGTVAPLPARSRGEPVDSTPSGSSRQGGGPRAPFPPAPQRADGLPREPRAPEPRMTSAEAGDDHGFRSQGYTPPRASEPPMVPETEEVPLSPRTSARPAPSSSAEPAAERKGWQSPGKRNTPDAAPRVPPAEPRVSDTQQFDKVWPAELRAPEPSDRDDDRYRPDAAPPRANGDATRHAEPARQPPADEPVSVLKSGVVDGMAYTLYTDGSIEAELAQGVVRFGSIEELRNHLEKSA